MTDSLISQDELKRILSFPEGRQILRDILAITGLFQQPFNQDQRATDFNCGRLNVGIILHAECMTASPDFTAMMYKEHDNGRRDNDDNGNLNGGYRSSNNDSGNLRRSDNKRGDHLGLGFERSGE